MLFLENRETIVRIFWEKNKISGNSRTFEMVAGCRYFTSQQQCADSHKDSLGID